MANTTDLCCRLRQAEATTYFLYERHGELVYFYLFGGILFPSLPLSLINEFQRSLHSLLGLVEGTSYKE